MGTENLLGLDDDIELLKHFLNILLKNQSTETYYMPHFKVFGIINLQHEIRI